MGVRYGPNFHEDIHDRAIVFAEFHGHSFDHEDRLSVRVWV